MKSRHQRSLSMLAFTFFLGVGTYNAVVINSDSQIGSDIKFVKRLDEVYGVTRPGRLVAASVGWKKISPQQNVKPHKVAQKVSFSQASSQREAAPEAPVVVAAVQEELNLNLIEAVNPKKWQQGLKPGQFVGSLTTRDGTIESLSVSLPNGEGVSVSFSEMAGNVFEYDLNGEIYTGMMYQVDRSTYMVNLSNGPLEGTRLKFIGETSPSQLEEIEAREVADRGVNSESDNYGQPTDEELAARYAETPIAPPAENFQAQEEPIYAAQGQPFYTESQAADLDWQYQQEALRAQGLEADQYPIN